MLRVARLEPGFALLLIPLLFAACSKDEAPPKEEAAPAAEAKKAEKPKATEAAKTPEAPPPPAIPLPAAVAPPAATLREGAPIIFAQYTRGVIVPIASRRGSNWLVEDVLTLDKMPEGVKGKDAHPDVLIEWWKKLDIQNGDTFVLRGDRGADGTFTVKRDFATADRGGCVGLVGAIPGEVKWTVKPKGHAEGGDAPAEDVWAFRGPWAPRPAALSRDLSKDELQAGKQLLQQTADAARQSLKGDPAAWQECDSLSDSPCKATRAFPYPVDLEADGKPELVATLQFKPEKAGSSSPYDARVLLSLDGKAARVLGKWEGDMSRSGEEGQAPIFAGMLDLTGDGRSEVIFRRVANETENWEIFQAVPDKPGEWQSLFKTQIEGC